MPDNQLDDFRAITDAEGVWFGPFDRDDLFGLIRLETEKGLRRQVSDSVLERIETFGTPMCLVLAREMDDVSKARVGHVAFAVRAHLLVSYAAGTRHERIEAALTFFFGNIDVPGGTVCSAHFELHGEAELNFNDTCFKTRVMAFRADVPDPPAVH